MFVKNGYKIFPTEIERHIMRHNLVENCAVVAIDDDINGKIAKAFVVLKNSLDQEGAKAGIMSILKDNLYDYEIPEDIILCDSLPLTGGGKIDFRALEKMAQQ